MKRSGEILWWSKRGFGIITSEAEDGRVEGFYCHITKVVVSPETIEAKQKVSFVVSGDEPKRPGDLPIAIAVEIGVAQ